MKINLFSFYSVIGALVLASSVAQAQAQRPPNTQPAPQPQQQPVNRPPQPQKQVIIEKVKPAPPTFRVLGGYEYSLVSPSDLNDYRSRQLWNNTTASQGTFSSMNGFTVGGGMRLGSGFLGLEYTRSFQELNNTQVTATTTFIQDTFEYESVFALYDLAFEIDDQNSFELGGGIGYALKYRYHNVLTANGVQEDVYWQDQPMAFKVRAFYNYHFTPNIIIRAGGQYEYVTSGDMTVDGNHPTVVVNGGAIINGQKLRNQDGSAVKVDMSGLRLSIGAAVAF
ncbi:hypothetical protein [Pseudobdellovibrio exovorus]|uniref:Outer membrane beta-barrel domain-containing protein n=1 Tax=Pseudobdellovibrio exovorus JSS TaxID=1184267 RepID=M4V7X5_9BACT|nr:hypothetical protein [Pseudobdellovibrio exovorus]AGH95477.1 hypothetical protein A11Q_1261 [Pseudobdellovibrio exovorus JSS]